MTASSILLIGKTRANVRSARLFSAKWREMGKNTKIMGKDCSNFRQLNLSFSKISV